MVPSTALILLVLFLLTLLDDPLLVFSSHAVDYNARVTGWRTDLLVLRLKALRGTC